jgi:hypothetical protein
MADTFTTNLNMTKPEVGASTDTWGTKLNTDLDTLDGIFKSDGTGTAVGLNTTGKSFAGTAGNISFKDATDATKIAKFDASTIATATTRTFTFPNVSGTFYLVGQAIDSTVIGGTTPAAGNFTNLILSAYGQIKALFETATITAAAPSATTNFDVKTQAVQYYTSNSTANFTFNVRGDSSTSLNSILGVGQSCTIALAVTNGSTAYYPNTIQVDGSTVTPKWQGGTAPTSGNASATDVYTFVVIKTASATFTVLASQTKFA